MYFVRPTTQEEEEGKGGGLGIGVGAGLTGSGLGVYEAQGFIGAGVRGRELGRSILGKQGV